MASTHAGYAKPRAGHTGMAAGKLGKLAEECPPRLLHKLGIFWSTARHVCSNFVIRLKIKLENNRQQTSERGVRDVSCVVSWAPLLGAGKQLIEEAPADTRNARCTVTGGRCKYHLHKRPMANPALSTHTDHKEENGLGRQRNSNPRCSESKPGTKLMLICPCVKLSQGLLRLDSNASLRIPTPRGAGGNTSFPRCTR